MILKSKLLKLYLNDKLSVQNIADQLGYSRRGVQYWMNKHNIPTRTMSDAVYVWHNPNGNPFSFRMPNTKKETVLFGVGLGLYWGEGTKSNESAIRLGNTSPELIMVFINFLTVFFGVKRNDLKFGLQIFSDLDPKIVLDFWIKKLEVKKEQFQKPVVTISGSIGTYRHKSEYGVVTVHYNNIKATQILQKLVADIASDTTASP